MLGKLLINDLKKNMRWLWILFVATLLAAGLSRGCRELGQDIMFFKILGIFFDSVFYALLVNTILQPFLKNFFNFSKSFYGDESYLTHTLPVTKSQLINSKYLTALIETVLGFVCLVASLLIMFYSPTMFDTLKFFLMTLISGEFSVVLVLALMVVLIMIEFLMYLSIIFFSIIVAYRAREKRVLKTFLLTMAMAFASLSVLAVAMVVVLIINKVDLSGSVMVLSNTAFFSLILTGIIVYSMVVVLFYFLAKKEFNKGVNVD